MRIVSTFIENFRGIRRLELTDLKDIVIIAGQNGSGKSCVLDAIRLIKSIYGGYQPNEYQNWFGEFQINFTNDPNAFGSLFNDPSQPLTIEVGFQISERERVYLRENATALITAQAWRALVPELTGWRSLDAAPLSTQWRGREDEVNQLVRSDLELFQGEIDKPYITAQMHIKPNDQPRFTPSKLLELVFSARDFTHFGIIDYYGAHRMYGREVLSNINVNVDALEEQRRSSLLYNYNAKYSNVKSEMASLYVREALAEKAGKFIEPNASVTDTLRELFALFFPDKEFLGPQPDENGRLRFPVKIGGRESHDLDELSSGEKEIIYGYLRLRNSAPLGSVILLDEPELHLNPKLTRNLPRFYHRHLSLAHGHQIWLITHSDAILRESVGQTGFSVFHMTPSASFGGDGSQSKEVEAEEDLVKAVIDLVGDLAAFNPAGRIVIFEGEDSEFDIRMVSELFPEMTEKANLISGSNKSRVQGLHRLLHRLSQEGKLPSYHVFSITDRDSGSDSIPSIVNGFTWDAYHIENYLLEEEYISQALTDLLGRKSLSANDVRSELLDCARQTIPSLLTHEITTFVNNRLIESISTRVNPLSENTALEVVAAIASSKARLDKLVTNELSESEIKRRSQSIMDRFKSSLADNTWKKTLRGRDILKRFVGKHGGGLKYAIFRNIIIARMRDNDFKPEGMKNVLEQVTQPRIIGKRD